MSNYDKDVYLDGRVVIGAEVMNGTGEVVISDRNGPDDETTAYLEFDADEAIEFALAVLRKAAKAKAFQLHEKWLSG